MFSRAKENFERVIFNIWLLFNSKKICKTLLDAKIKPDFVSTYFKNIHKDWTNLEFYNSQIDAQCGAGLIYIAAGTKYNHEYCMTYILTKSQALDYRKHTAYQILKGNVEYD